MSEIDKKRQEVIQRESEKPGMRGKINAKCTECIYDPLGGNGAWRQQVEACTSYDCPLYSVRPTSRAGKADLTGVEGDISSEQYLGMGEI